MNNETWQVVNVEFEDKKFASENAGVRFKEYFAEVDSEEYLKNKAEEMGLDKNVIKHCKKLNPGDCQLQVHYNIGGHDTPIDP